MNTRTIIIISVIVVVLAFLGGMALKDSSDTVDNESPSPSASVSASPTATVTPTPTPVTHTIRRTANGVSPQNLTIRVGDTVVFVNDAASSWWPASDPHPIHTLCPGFDARRGLQQGESYSLMFEEARTCPFHNHVAPADAAQQGTITVQ